MENFQINKRNNHRIQVWCLLKQNVFILPGKDIFLCENQVYKIILTELELHYRGIKGKELLDRSFEITRFLKADAPNKNSIRDNIRVLLLSRLIRTIGRELAIDTLGLLYLHDYKNYCQVISIIKSANLDS